MSLGELTCFDADCLGNLHCLRSRSPGIIDLGGGLEEDILIRMATDSHSGDRAVGRHLLFHLGRRLGDTAAVHSQVKGISAMGDTINGDGNFDNLTMRRIVTSYVDHADIASNLAALVSSLD